MLTTVDEHKEDKNIIDYNIKYYVIRVPQK
jgi:hypothetical protein